MADQLTPYELSQALVGRKVRYVSGRLMGKAGQPEKLRELTITLDDGQVLKITGHDLVAELLRRD